MLQGVGRRQGGDRPDTVMARLESCHTRIRHFIALAAKLSDDGHEEGEVQGAAESVRRYFSAGFSQHVLDEDECVLPKLAAPELAQQVHREHERDDLDVAALVSLTEALSYDPSSVPLREQLGALMTRLGPNMEAHLAFEEQTMFPLVQKLPAEAERSIFHAMEARREARRGQRGLQSG